MRALEAEQAVLGSILIDARCLETVTRTLRPQDFGVETNRGMYQVILAMDRAGQRIDPVTVLESMKRASLYIEGQTREYILQLMDTTPTAANVEEYAKIVREEALRRGAAALAEYIIAELAGHRPTQEVLMAASRRLADLQKDGVTDDLLGPDDALLAFYRHRELVDQGKGAFVPTGYQDIDSVLGGGMLNSGMYILAARPGVGKTTLAINIAERVAKAGKAVLFVSLEMETEQIESKRLALRTGIPSNRLLTESLTEEEWTAVAHTGDMLLALPIYLNERDTVTVAQVEQMARRVDGLGLIVIDYIGKITPDTQGRKPNRVEYMTEISGEIKNLARRFKVPVLTLCQLNRAGADRKDPTPILSDLRDTGAIEQDADGVIFLHRADYYRPQGGGNTTSDLQVILAKNRHGAVGECTLAFDLAGSKLTTSRRGPIARRKEYRAEPLGPTQMTWEDLSGEIDRKMPYDREDTTT